LVHDAPGLWCDLPQQLREADKNQRITELLVHDLA
jgi:hypothetical protein